MNKSIFWQWTHFTDLSIEELYQIMSLRQKVFSVEQGIVYQDADGQDTNAYHLLGWVQEQGMKRLAAYLRVLPAGSKYEEPSLGRVITAPEFRGFGFGKKLLQEALRRIEATYGKNPVRISAQAYLEKFYNDFGFRKKSDLYLEKGIEHIEMLRH